MLTENVRLPEVFVTANGAAVLDVLEVGVDSNSFLGADRFHISCAFTPINYEVWSDDSIDITINIAVNDASQEIIRGSVDRVELDVGGGLVHIDGRDLTARLIEARTQETFENRTASDVVEFIALRRGLTPNVSATTDLIGRNYGGDYSRVTLDQYSATTTEWDLLTRLASYEGFDVWVEGQTLNFVPPQQSLAPFIVRPSDCQALRMERALGLTSGLDVTVRSWDCRAHAAVTQVASAGQGANRQSFILVKPNLTEFEAAALARRVLSQMMQNARIVSFDLPGELDIKPRQSIALVGSDTDFDGQYVITTVERSLSFRRGFTETVQARTPPWTIF